MEEQEQGEMEKHGKQDSKKQNPDLSNCPVGNNLVGEVKGFDLSLSLPIEFSVKSSEVIATAAFRQHKIRDVSQSQLVGALKSLGSPEVRRRYRVADKATSSEGTGGARDNRSLALD